MPAAWARLPAASASPPERVDRTLLYAKGGLAWVCNHAFTPAWTAGWEVEVGARYWAMWTQQGEVACTDCEAPGVTSPPNPSKNSMERYGVFFQAAYQFDQPVVVTAKN
jgi:hypothetical protein